MTEGRCCIKWFEYCLLVITLRYVISIYYWGACLSLIELFALILVTVVIQSKEIPFL